MTTTNRLANRLVLLLAGLLLLALGSLAVLANVPQTAPTLIGLVDRGRDELQRVVEAAGTTTVHTIALAIAVVVALLALLVAVNRGRGRVATVVDRDSGQLPGSVELGTPYLQAALTDALGRRPDLLTADLSAWRDAGRTTLLIRARPRAGAPVRAVIEEIRDAVQGIDALLDRPVPVLLHVASSPRAALARPDRVQ